MIDAGTDACGGDRGRLRGALVDLAALNQRLKQMGHDSAKELDERLKVVLARKDGP